MIVVVHGPMACGKTHNRDAIAKRFGCAWIIDSWHPADGRITNQGRGNTLALTYAAPDEIRAVVPGAKIVSFDSLGFSKVGTPS